MKRDRFEIIRDILHLAEDFVRKTYIMYNADLGYSQNEEYLKLLTNPFISIKKITGKRRTKLLIILDILNKARYGTLKTYIMRNANLSFDQLKKYYGLLIYQKLLEVTDKNKIKTTKRGLTLINNYKNFQEVFSTHGELLKHTVSDDTKLYRRSDKGQKFLIVYEGLEKLWKSNDPSDRRSSASLYSK
jgi:predicted transcriptional regulator